MPALAFIALAGSALEVRTQAVERPGVCLRDGTKLVGATPVQISRSVTQPKKTRNVNPKYPDVEVWTIQEVRFKPAFPPFNQAIVDAIRQWEFEPLIISGSAVSACAPVTIAIHWS